MVYFLSVGLTPFFEKKGVGLARNTGEEAEGGSGLLRWVALDVAPRQRLLQLVNLCLGEVGVTSEIQPR